MRTEPSAWRLFSKKAMSIRGGATTVLLRVWAKYSSLLPSLRTRIPRRRAWASPRLEQEPTSKYFCCPYCVGTPGSSRAQEVWCND